MFLLKTSLESQSDIYTAKVGKKTFLKATKRKSANYGICKKKKYAFPDL